MTPLQALVPGAILNVRGHNAGARAREGKGRRANLWFFHSNKRDKLLRVYGDVFFVHVVLAELDPSITWFSWPEESEHSDDGSAKHSRSELHVRFVDGSQEIWSCSRNGTSATPTHNEQGIPVLRKTEADVQKKLICFDNYLMLSTALTAARNFDINPAYHAIRRELLTRKRASFGQLTALPGFDTALLQAAIAQLYVRREIAMDIGEALLTQNTEVRRITSEEQR